MSRTYKWLGGIGYILSFIPYVNAISLILVAVAWIMMGRDTREKVFTALGILLIILFAASIIIVLAIFASIFALIPVGMMAPRAAPFTGLGALLGTMIAVAVVVLAIALAVLFLDVIAHFRAARIFNSRWFKLGGWLRVATIIALVISIPVIAFSVLSLGLQGILGQLTPGALSFGLLLSILWPLMIVMILSLLATIFSIIAFFTIPEETL